MMPAQNITPPPPCWHWMQCRQEAQSGTQALAHISGSSSVTLTSSMKRTSWELVFIYLCAQAICFSLWVFFRVVQAMSPFKNPALGASRQRSSPNMFKYGSTCATEVFSHLSMYFFFFMSSWDTLFSNSFIMSWFGYRAFHIWLQCSYLLTKLFG